MAEKNSRIKKTVLTSVKFIFFSLLFFLLVFNLLLSQLVSPLYFYLMKENRRAAVIFLKKIKDLPQFNYFFAINEKLWGSSLKNEIFAQEKKRKQQIDFLRSLLPKNQKARDVLFNLSTLYRQEKNYSKADQYLKKARGVDPDINKN